MGGRDLTSTSGTKRGKEVLNPQGAVGSRGGGESKTQKLRQNSFCGEKVGD